LHTQKAVARLPVYGSKPGTHRAPTATFSLQAKGERRHTGTHELRSLQDLAIGPS
jgi:hypothetical protein